MVAGQKLHRKNISIVHQKLHRIIARQNEHRIARQKLHRILIRAPEPAPDLNRASETVQDLVRNGTGI